MQFYHSLTQAYTFFYPFSCFGAKKIIQKVSMYGENCMILKNIWKGKSSINHYSFINIDLEYKLICTLYFSFGHRSILSIFKSKSLQFQGNI